MTFALRYLLGVLIYRAPSVRLAPVFPRPRIRKSAMIRRATTTRATIRATEVAIQPVFAHLQVFYHRTPRFIDDLRRRVPPKRPGVGLLKNQLPAFAVSTT